MSGSTIAPAHAPNSRLLPRVVDQALRKQLPIIQRFARNKH
ncbi:hypothetical protein [Pseudomonas zhanjiangensis]|uniref:Uncharacterized protein n=1 Tax=Pseudomonas zhanjiangensis TaxID=3239015 RepID=A0ABV3YUL5_9PSED